MKIILFSLLSLLGLTCPAAVWAQQGKTGVGNLTAASTIVNEYTTLTTNAVVGATSITVASNTLNANSRFGGSLAAGDLVMLVQMQGATIDVTATSSSYGNVTAYNNAGKNELLEVKSVAGLTTINFYCGTTNAYTVAGRVQVVRVPRYTTLTLAANATLTAPAWNGSTGGVVAVEAQGNVVFNTNSGIDASGLGFRGGAVHNMSVSPSAGSNYASTSTTYGGEKGEGIAGYQADYDGLGGRYGRGAPANGGGGGNTHNASGGGGANVGTGTWTGTGNPDRGTANAYDAAWNQESANFATSTSPGGGRGGYTYSSSDQNALAVGPGQAAWGGDSRRNLGGLGGRPLTATGGLLFLGGGGGAGDENDNVGGNGGNGGGLVYLLVGGTLGNASGATGTTVRANGAAGASTTGGGNDAPGGGGGGGTVVLNVAGGVASVAVTATGGAGGLQTIGGPEAEGPAGGGGGGYILYTTASPTLPPSNSVVAGAGGTTSSSALSEFKPNGATAGGSGLIAQLTYATQCALVADVTTTFTTAPTTVLAGAATGNYTVQFTNNGPDVASTLIRQVTLPAGATLTAAQLATITGAGGTTSTNGGVITIDFGSQTNVAAGSSSFTFSFTAPTTPGSVAVASTTNTDAQGTNQGSSGAANSATAPLTVNASLAGYVFEDMNYGGGRGRDRAAPGTAGQQGARVELYTAAGAYLTSTTTDVNGQYFLPFTASIGYTVRVVNSTVTSSRTGYASGLLPVQTYAGTTGDANAVSRVGGQDPSKVDAGTNSGTQTLGNLTTTTTVAESQAGVTAAANGNTTGPNFGFSFDVVVNASDAGQGSLRQFLLNSNALGGESSLAQVYTASNGTTTSLTAGQETSVFMVPNGQAVAGQLAGLTSGFSTPTSGSGTGVTIKLTSAKLPNITGPNTTIDGSTQTRSTGDTNAAVTTLGSESLGPEVTININGLTGFAAGAATQLLNMGLTGVNANTGSIGAAFSVPSGADGSLVRGNTFYNNGSNLRSGNVSNIRVDGNIARDAKAPESDGIEVTSTTNSFITNNQFLRNSGYGIDWIAGTSTGNSITGNLFSGNGQNTGNGQTAGVGLRTAGATSNTFSGNTFTDNVGAGIAATAGNGNVFSQNSFSGNGGLGIDLGVVNTADYSGDGVTKNDNGDPDANGATTGGNGLLNFPVLTRVVLNKDNTLTVSGYARPNTLVELYLAADDLTHFGEGQTYLTGFTQAAAAGTTGSVTTGAASAYSGTQADGLDQGSDNTFTFTFTYVPTAAQLTALQASGALLTATATLSTADANNNFGTSEFAGNARVLASPVPNTLTNAAIPNTSGATVLNPNLSAGVSGPTANVTTSTANSVQYYTITSLPAQGTLTYNGTTLTAGNIATTQILPGSLNTLTYTPVSGSTVGSVSFQYTATDANGVTSTTNSGGTSGPATYAIPVSQVADVATSLAASPSPVLAGQPLSFSVGYLNNGPNLAAGYTQSLTLTAGLGASNVTFSNLPTGVTASYNNATGAVTFTGTPTTLGNGSNQNLTVTIGAVPSGLSGVTASTTVGTSTNQGADTGANSATLTVPVTPVADVATSIAANPTTAFAGAGLTLTYTFRNNGPSTAASYTRSITLPAGLGTGVTVTGGAYNNATGAVTFTSPPTTLASQTNADVTVSIPSVPDSFTANGLATSSSTSTGTSQNGATSNDNASLTVPVTPVANVTTTVTGPATVTGNVATTNNAFTATFTNNGPSQAQNVTRVLTLPPGATMTAAQVSASGGTYAAPSSNTTSGTLTFSTLGTLSVGAANASTATFGFVPYNGGSSPVATTSTVGTSTSQNGATGNDTGTFSSTVKFTPVPAYVTAASVLSTSGQTAIADLTATDQDGTIASYTIQTIPPGTQGTLFYNNGTNYVPVTGVTTLTPAQAQSLRFDPTGAYAGNVTFTYSATDNEGNASTTYTNSGTIGQGYAVYTIPVASAGISANNDSNVAPLNTASVGNVLLNDTNPDNSGLVVSTTGAVVSGTTTTVFNNGTATTTHGTVTITAAGAYTYTPATGYTGPDTFAYQVCTNSGTGCMTALVSIRVYDPGTACTSSTGTNLLANPSFNSGNTDFQTDYTYVASPSTVTNGNTGLRSENTYAVTNDAHLYHSAFYALGRSNATNANDQFLAINGSGNVQRTYSQTVAVQPGRYYTFSAYFNNLLSPASTNNGVPELGFVINGESTSGTVVVSASPDRWIGYSDIWYSGTNTSATFEIRNRSTAANGNDFGIDDVYFGTCNLPPVANNDLRTTPLNTAITFSATANDTDGDGTVTASSCTFSNGSTSIAVTGGTFVVDNAGSVTFTPTTGFTGTVNTTYTVKDNDGATSSPGTLSVTVGPPPVDLATTIAASAATVNARATETLTMTASNAGTTTASSVTQTVQLPAGLTGVTFGTPTVGSGATLVASGAGSTPSYNATTGLVTFPTIATQASGSTGNVQYTVSFAAPAAGPFTATATVGSSVNTDSNPANNAASTTVAVSPQFDLVTTISGPTTASAGNPVTYTVTSANNGPSAAPNAQQVVTGLPSGLSQVFVSNGGYYNSSAIVQTVYYTGAGFTTTSNGTTAYTVAGGGVIFPPVASFASGLSQSNTIAFVAPAAAAVITPVAQLTPSGATDGETAPTTNTAGLNGTTGLATTATAATGAAANVRVNSLGTTVGGVATTLVAAGSSVTANVTFGNAGPASAAGVFYQLNLTPGTTVTSLPTGATYNTTTGIVTFNATGAALASAGTQAYAVTFAAPTTGPVLVAASVSSTTPDAVSNDNFASTKVDVQPAADLATTLAGPTTALAGQTVTYAVTTANSGAATATNVGQTVGLPAGLSATSLRLNGVLGTLGTMTITFTSGATYNVGTGLLTLPTAASVAKGSITTNEITFPAPGGMSSFVATAAVSGTTPDGVATNNTASVTTTVTPSTDVRTLVSGLASVPVFSPLTYSVTTTNDGLNVAPTVNPTLQLPANLTNVTYPSGASYSSSTGLVTFATINNLASGASVTNSVSFTMPDVAQVAGLASSAVSGVTDRNADNNRVSLTTTATTPTDNTSDLGVTLTTSATGAVMPGTSVSFTLTVSNGPSSTYDSAPNVVPVLDMPAGLNVTTLQVAGQTGTYSAGTGLLTFPNGATYNYNTGRLTLPTTALLVASDATGYTAPTYTVTLPAPGTDPLLVTASVSSDNSDPAPANNVTATSVTITPQADLVTSISGPATVPAPGGLVTYAVTTINNGASVAVNSTTTVVLPLASGATYSLNGGTTQTYNGTGVTLPVVASQQPGADGVVTNTLSFTAPSGTPGSIFQVSVPVANATTTTAETSTTNNGSAATTTRANVLPVARNVVNSVKAPTGNTATAQQLISPLAATDADGTVSTYQLTALPPASQGVMYYNNNADGSSGSYVALPTGTNLSAAQANSLRYLPASSFAGNALFTYTATDNLGGVSAPALYTLPVGLDNSSVATATTQLRGGSQPYQNNDVLTYVIDANGAQYTAGGLVYNAATGVLQGGAVNGLVSAVRPTGATSGPASNPTNALPGGVSLDPVTGQLYVSNASALPRVQTATTYAINVITTDLYGGVNTVTETFVLGAYPLPVELVAFTAQAVGNRDGLLKWTTASELNNDHFELERNLDGVGFTKFAQVAGQGSKASATNYSFLDAGAASRVAAGQPVYYRLRQVDTGGRSTYSPVRTVAFTGAGLVTLGLYPNPAASATSLDLRSLPTGNSYRVLLLDAVGREARQLTLSGGQLHELGLSEVASGTYQVLITGQQPDGSVLRQVIHLTKE